MGINNNKTSIEELLNEAGDTFPSLKLLIFKIIWFFFPHCKPLASSQEIEELPLKKRLEYQKIQAETQELKRPLYLKPAFYGAIAPVILVLAGIAITWWFGLLDIQKENRRAEISLLNKQIKELEEAIKDMSSFTNWYDKGVGEYQNKRYGDAISSFKKALSKKSNNDSKSYAYNFIGSAYLNLDKSNEALVNFKKSTDYRWNNPLPHLNMADIYLEQSRIGKAEEEIRIINDLLEEGKFEGSEKAYAEETIKSLKEKLEEAKKKEQ